MELGESILYQVCNGAKVLEEPIHQELELDVPGALPHVDVFFPHRIGVAIGARCGRNIEYLLFLI